MIETIEVIDWREELKVWSWGLELQKKVNNGDFRYTTNFEEHGVSDELTKAFRDLQSLASKNTRNTARLVAFLNYKLNEAGRISMPSDGTDRYWLRINGRVIHIEFMDEYEGDGMMNRGINVPYIDKAGDDTFWLDLVSEFTQAINGELAEMDSDFVEQWADYYP